jgi:hypothetical protein
MKNFILICGVLLMSIGCSQTSNKDQVSSKGVPIFTLSTSEYPSWATFLVAEKMGLISKDPNKLGTLEQKYGVKIIVKATDYDTCLTYYGNGVVDAVCVTNTDTLNPCIGRPGTAIMPTSTSDGADAVISTTAKDVEGLKKVGVYGLSKSVSEYVFRRGLEVQNLDPKDFKFVHLDPGPAATALQTGTSEIKAICVWNPFKLTVVRKNPEAKVIFTSQLIPLEVIDMVVVANDSLQKPQGENFAKALCEAYYTVAAAKDAPETAEATLAALGEDFFALSPADMKICCTETKFFGKPELGIALFSGDIKEKNVQVLKTCKDIGIIEKDPPTVGYDDPSKQLNFSTQYMRACVK